jgi:hypothetical protein
MQLVLEIVNDDFFVNCLEEIAPLLKLVDKEDPDTRYSCNKRKNSPPPPPHQQFLDGQ